MLIGPQFRLIRMIESRHLAGNLENIDALLGCPVYCPSETYIDKFTSLSMQEQHTVLSCLFYTINWFRELINTFATQKDKDLKDKVCLAIKIIFNFLFTKIREENWSKDYLTKNIG